MFNRVSAAKIILTSQFAEVMTLRLVAAVKMPSLVLQCCDYD